MSCWSPWELPSESLFGLIQGAMKTTCCVLLVVCLWQPWKNTSMAISWTWNKWRINGRRMEQRQRGVFARSCGKRWSWFVTVCASGLLSCPVSWYYIVVQGKRSVSPTKQVMMAKWSLLLGRGRTHAFPVCDRAWYQGIIFQATRRYANRQPKKSLSTNFVSYMTWFLPLIFA